jgi:solute carrier family 8 (sodium/calcium exchanger)
VALGTSLPDTFASKAAAANEKTADNAIGNVTGSNSVNVFMGLGIPWVIASVYWAIVVSYRCYKLWPVLLLMVNINPT